MWRAFLVGAGGLAGSLGRYWLSGLVQGWSGAAFPLGTFAVNLLGSFLIGLVMVLSVERNLVGPDLRLFLTTGFMGGFTTMSTFSFETLGLLSEGSMGLAAANVALTLVLCLAGVWLGSVAARFV